MDSKFVWNENTAEQIKSENRAIMNSQIEAMTATVADHQKKIAELEEQAKGFEDIARNAMKTITSRNSDGSISYSEIPDTARREKAAADARRVRAEIADLRRAISALNSAKSELTNGITLSSNLFDNLRDFAQSEDVNYAGKTNDIKDEIADYARKMRGIYDSFHNTFPMSVSTNLLSSLRETIHSSVMGIGVISRLMGRHSRFMCENGDPVNMSTGNFIYHEDDIEITGRFPLVFKRFYNSISTSDGALGTNWTHNFNITLCEKDKAVNIAFDDGHVETYHELDSGIYTSPLEHMNTLTKTETGFTLTFPSKEKYQFDSGGKLSSIVDLNKNITWFSYAEKLLTKVSNSCGFFCFNYDKENRVVAIVDNTNREVKLEYENDKLTKVIQASGAVRRYEYDKFGNLSKLRNPLEVDTIINEYDKNGRVVKQTFADGGVYSLSYNDLATISTEQNGNKVKYFRDEKYRTVKISYSDSQEIFEYNDNNNRTFYSDRNKNIRRFEYDKSGNILKMTDPLSNITLLEYNDFNKPVKITNPDGGIITNKYDERGNLTVSADPINRVVNFTHDERGLVTELVLPDGGKNAVKYDNKGNITAFKDANESCTLYEYDKFNRVTKTTDPNGNLTLFEYNLKGDIVKVTSANGECREYEYNIAGNLTKLTDFDGGVTIYNYNKMGKVCEVINTAGDVTKLEYDKMWNVICVTDTLGNTQKYEYNKLNRLVKSTDQEGNETHYEHDPNGNVTAIISPLGIRTEIDYDPLDRQKEIREADGAVTKLEYDKIGNLTKVTDPQSGEILRDYDKAGQLLSVTDQDGNVTKYTYNLLGQPETVTDALGGKQTYSYYPGGRLKSVTTQGEESEHYEYDKNGNISKVTDAAGNATTVGYDCVNRIKTITNPLGNVKYFSYDAAGNITSIIDENGSETKYVYSLTGELVEVIDALGNSTRYGYDKGGRMTRVEQYRLLDKIYADLKHIELQVTTWERNKRGEVTKMTTPLGGETCYNYDKIGNLISKTDEDGLETLYQYNNVNNLTKVIYADGKTVELSYNSLRQLKEMRDWLGVTNIETDNLGRATKVTDFSGESIQYEWDALSRRKAVVYPDNSRVCYSYDASGKLHKVISAGGEICYNYDTLGRVQERVMSSENIVTKYKSDPLGRLQSLVHSKNGDILDSFSYTYDPAGNITQIDKFRVGAENDSGIFKYTYDKLSRLTQAANGANIKQYHYDSLGNRVSSIQNNIETRHSYNSRNQLIRTQETDLTRDYNYDARGNLTSVLENGIIKESYTFDAANRMATAVTGKGRAEYTYNGFLKRVKKLETLEKVHVSNSPNDPLSEVKYTLDLTRPYNDLLSISGSANQRFVWSGELLAAEGDENFRYLNDHLGSPIRLVGEHESEVLSYDEFGVPTVEKGVKFHNPFGFTGYQLDKVSSLHFAQARYYNSTTGRFISEDGARDGVNWYGYCANNPVKFVDPLGLVAYKVGGLDDKPEFIFDSTFPYDPNEIATSDDRLSWVKWGVMLEGSKLVPWLSDASKAYGRYRSNTGKDLRVNYGKAYRQDETIKKYLDSELYLMAQFAKSNYLQSGDTSFEIIGDMIAIPNGATENWQKTIGAHQAYGHGVVTINEKKRTAQIKITFYMEDMYNFNPGMSDLATDVPDDVNGRFSTLGWAKEFKTYGQMTKTIEFNLDCLIDGGALIYEEKRN